MKLLIARRDQNGKWQKVAMPTFTKDGSQFTRRPKSLGFGTLESLWAKQAAAYFAAQPGACQIDYEHGTTQVRVNLV